MNILVIAAHPDDEILGVGGTIYNHVKRGDSVYVCVLTDGASSQYPNERAMIDIKKMEATKVGNILGIKEYIFIDLPDMKLDTVPIVEINKYIEECVRKIKPEIVYTHHHGDINRDHRIAYEATLVATRPLNSFTVKKVFSYEIPSSHELFGPFPGNYFLPNVFVNIKDSIEKKIEAMKEYQSEIRDWPHPRSIEAIKSVAKKWGMIAGFDAAEAFVLIRELQG